MEAQKIIITGGATRIGAAIAEKLYGPNTSIPTENGCMLLWSVGRTPKPQKA